MWQKLSRTLVHMTSGPLYVAMWPLFSRAPAARYCAALICVINALRCESPSPPRLRSPA